MDSSTKRLLIILPRDSLNGSEQYLKMVAKFYISLNWFVDVYFLVGKERKNYWNDISSERCNLYFTKQSRELTGIIGLTNLLIENKLHYDRLFTSHVHINALAGFLRKLGLITTKFHIGRESSSLFFRSSGIKRFYYKSLYNYFYSTIDLLICQTSRMKEQLIDQIPHLNKKVRVIPNPIDMSLIIESENPMDEIKFPYIVAAGRLNRVKGFDILISAFSMLKNKYPDLKLLILGEGDERETIEKQIEEEDLINDVVLKGHVNNVYPYFKGAEVCVVSSRVEGFPNVLLQMMSQNDKVVSTTCAGDIDKIIGIITCEPSDSEKLYIAIEKALLTNSSSNRIHFNKELDRRKINHFIKKVDSYLSV